MQLQTTRKQKKTLRESILEKEMQLSLKEKQLQDWAICENLIQLDPYKWARTVFCFVGVQREIDTKALILTSFALGKKVAVPLCTGKGVMEARRIGSLSDLEVGSYGLLEPKAYCPVVQPSEIDFAVIPCVSCDKFGHRLGRGGGYYDRYLPKLQCACALVCRESLMTPNIPIEPHDKAVNMIVTEREVIDLNERQ